MNKKQKIISGILALIAVIAIVATALLINNKTNPDKTNQNQSQALACPINEEGTVITYKGEEGKTALAILQERCEVQTTSSEYGDYVNTIESKPADTTTQYWAFFINDEYATIGAGAYDTTNGDTIKWQLETIE